MPGDTVSAVRSLAQEWGISVSVVAAGQIGRFFDELLVWNERLNLTGARGLSELLGEQLPDSFALSNLCPEGASVVDVGSGGGLPAIPFAILRPDCRVTLVEARAKRVAFLHTATRVCECNSVAVVRTRVEDLETSGFSVASSRATFKPEAWLELAPRLLRTGGRAVVFAARSVGDIPTTAQLVAEVEYKTVDGAPRWSGSYCFT
jgi:16S rRNA (guanine527-N7)-methyltransferase